MCYRYLKDRSPLRRTSSDFTFRCFRSPYPLEGYFFSALVIDKGALVPQTTRERAP